MLNYYCEDRNCLILNSTLLYTLVWLPEFMR
jgi:hypothetical protein